MQKSKKFMIFSLLIIVLCCISAASAADTNINNDTLTDQSLSIDEDVVSDTQSDETDLDESVKETSNVIESVGTEVDAEDWTELKEYCEYDDDYIITLTGTSYNANSQISFQNSATIIGTDDSYITGGSSSLIPFYSTGDKSITFLNVKFKNMDASILMRLSTTGVNKFINCSFDNIHTYAWQSSVIWNNGGWMTLSGCNFTNCNDGYGVITNHLTYNTVFMSVENCIFENNYGRIEPGAINNCGILNVTECTFNNNRAGQWAGAIHTHTNAYTKIKGSTFTNNLAGTNGGALYTYSKLEIYDSTFSGNNCTTNNGGGAIGAYSFGSTYNITIDSCKFINNINLCNALNNVSTTSLGRGGAIGTLNAGYLTIANSNFTNNFARIGQAIAAATYTVDNGTNGDPHLKIYNNRFVNHTGTADTVVIAGNDYLFENNTFINSVQTTIYTGNGNSYNAISNLLLAQDNDLLSFSISDSILGDGNPHKYIYVNSSSSNNANNVDGQNWTNAYGKTNGISRAVTDIIDGGIIYLADVTFTQATFGSNKNYTVIGFKDKTILTSFTSKDDNYNNTIHTFINITFNLPNTKKITIENGVVFINCTFVTPNFILNNKVATDSPQNTANVISSYIANFTNCYFANSTIDGVFITANKFTQANFNNCTFENITAESLIYSNTDGGREDGINVYNSTFKNINVIGIADIQQDYLLTFENNIYDSSVNIRVPEPVYTSISMEATGKGNITFTLTDENGNAIENATLIITGPFSQPKEVKTDGNGQYVLTGIDDEVKVKATFNEVKHKYAASVSEDRAYNFTDLGKTVVISLENTTSDNKGIVKVTLVNELNEVIANANVTYKVNGVESNATTDENGSFVISNLVGDNEIFVSFAGDSFNQKNITQKFTFPKEETKPAASNTTTPSTPAKTTTKTTAKVTKKATKITAKKATFKAKKKTKKYSITLKAGKSAVKKVKVTLKVGKKTYKATTNSKGKATFKITKLTKKGKYTATIKFAGNKNFKATSKKVKITVKK